MRFITVRIAGLGVAVAAARIAAPVARSAGSILEAPLQVLPSRYRLAAAGGVRKLIAIRL